MVLSREELGRLIKEARKVKSQQIGRKYTQSMLAKDVGISRSYLGDIETGRTYPNYVLLNKIARTCGVPLSFFSDIENRIDDYLSEQLAGYSTEIQEMVKNAIKQRDDVKLDFLSGLEKDNICIQGFPQKSSPLVIMETGFPYNIENLPIVGTIRAGEPILATENIEGYFPTDKQFLRPGEKYFYLRVKGDSMDKEFQEGSLLLVQKQNYIENGQIGVVLIDNEEATVKRVYLNEKIMTLFPNSNNPMHQPRIINLEKEDVRIIGRVILAIKKY